MAELVHEFSYDAESGTFAIRAGDQCALSGAGLQAVLEDRQLDGVFLEVVETVAEEGAEAGLGRGRWQTFRFAETDGLVLALEVFTPTDGAAIVLRLTLTNTGDAAVRVHELAPLVLEGEGPGALGLDLGVPSGEWAVLREGWHSWSPSGVVGLGETDFESGQPGEEGLRSEAVTVLAAPAAGRAVLIGWLEEKRFFAQVLSGKNGDSAWLRARAAADGVALEPGRSMASAPLVVQFTTDPYAALERYGDLFAERMQSLALGAGTADSLAARSPTAGNLTGWLSWYSGLKQNISEAAILANLERYAATGAERWRLRYWVIDDGWQSVAGDWLIVDAEKFPRGLKAVAEAIRQRGLEPGLWLAPFLVSEASVLAREHVDWLLKDERGEVVTAFQFSEDSHWRGRQFALDVTHPEAADYLRRVIRTIVREWGFSFIKADFLFAAALPAARNDPAATCCAALRRGLQMLRDEVGQRFLLGCGCPTAAAVGLVDACRTGPDVAPYWMRGDVGPGEPATQSALRNVVARWWQHGRWYVADPDAVMVRPVNTELTQDEVETLATVAGMSGGLVMWSDALEDVSEDRRLILDKLLPPWPVAARPINLFKGEPWTALLWRLRQGDLKWQVVALLNLSNFTANLSLELADLGLAPGVRRHAFELWRQTYHGAVEGELALRAVPAHGARVVALRPVTGGLDFLASDLHLTMDAVFCRVHERGLVCDVALDGRLRRRGRLFFHAPDGYVVRTNSPPLPAGPLSRRPDGAWSIEVDTAAATQYHLEAGHQ